MASAPELGRDVRQPVSDTAHVYSICYLDPGMVVPDVALVEADSDEEAVEYARTSRSFTTREIWDRHRLVAVIPSRQARVA
jgi:hypothetical protein